MLNTSFLRCKITETYFTDTNLNGSNFSESDLSKTEFHNSNLSKVDFRKAINYSLDPRTNKIREAKFSNPDVIGLLKHFEIIIE